MNDNTLNDYCMHELIRYRPICNKIKYKSYVSKVQLKLKK